MGLLYDVAKFFIKKETDKEPLLGGVVKSFKNDAITLKAKEAVNMYPVLFSESVLITDENLVHGINGYLEQQYAIFTMLATGLTPVLGEDEKVRNYLNKFYTHECDNEVSDKDYITQLIGETESDAKDDDYVFVEDGIPDVTDKVNPKIGLSSKEMEEMGFFNPAFTEERTFGDPRRIIWDDDHIKSQIKQMDEKINIEKRLVELKREYKKSIGREYGSESFKGTEADKGGREPLIDDVSIKQGRGYSQAQIDKIVEKSKSTDPTIVRVKFQVPNLTEVVEIPIAVKTVVHPLSPEESSQIFTYLKEDRAITTFVRLLSGEIKLFKDIIFQLDRAKQDKDLYNKLGRHPWFRQLIHRKQNKRARNLASVIEETKDMMGGKTDTLPIATLIVTKEEIEKGYSNTFNNILRQKDDIMNKMMLLAIGVVDPITSKVTFMFYGLNDPVDVKFNTLISEFKGGKGDNEKDASQLLKQLIYKI